jgi:hypothetical protein
LLAKYAKTTDFCQQARYDLATTASRPVGEPEITSPGQSSCAFQVMHSLTACYNPRTRCVTWFHKHLLYLLSHSSCFVCNYSAHIRVLMFYRPQIRHERNSPSTPPSPVAPSKLVRSPLHPQRRTTLMQSSQYTLVSHPSSQTPACGVWSPTSLLFLVSGSGPSAERKV